MEHALLGALYTGAWVTGQPVALHFRVGDPRPDVPLRPVPVADPEVRIARVWVNGEAWSDFDDGEVTLPAGAPAMVRVELEGPAAGRAMPALAPGRFDLVVHGEGLEGVDVWLRARPDRGREWVECVGGTVAGGGTTLLAPSLETGRLLGGDLRENHLTLRVVAAGDGVAIRSCYALPHRDGDPVARAASLDGELRTVPVVVERRAVAALVRPRPRPLTPDEPWIEHILAPVRHRPPGIVEVEWLDLLFR